MSDIVARLRRATDGFWAHTRLGVIGEAADEIERLQARIATHEKVCLGEARVNEQSAPKTLAEKVKEASRRPVRDRDG